MHLCVYIEKIHSYHFFVTHPKDNSFKKLILTYSYKQLQMEIKLVQHLEKNLHFLL